MATKPRAVRLLRDWARFKTGHVFVPYTIGMAKTLIAKGTAEWADESPKTTKKAGKPVPESTSVDAAEETAAMPAPTQRRRGRARTNADRLAD